MQNQNRTLLSYVQKEASRRLHPFSTDDDKINMIEKLTKNSEEDYARFKEGIGFRYIMCAIIGVSFGLLCYTLFRRMYRNEDDDQSDNGNETECIVCRQSIRRVVFTPCLHLICCYECAASVNVCPMCRVPLEGKYTIKKFLNQLES